MRATITEALVKGAGEGFIRDDRVQGFALRTTLSGFKSSSSRRAFRAGCGASPSPLPTARRSQRRAPKPAKFSLA